MANEVAEVRTRLPMPQREGLDNGLWRVLCESAFPSAKSAEAILLALDYCKARKLDPLKKMVHIVPMWSSQLGREVETVWPGIAEVQTTATRTGKYAGMDEPKFGPDITRTFRGVRGKNVGETEITVTFPEWCSITVYRIVDGQRCPFTEPVYWLEAYGRGGKSELPNDQWVKRPRGMIMKVAKAFSLRGAFPEEADYTREEMEGRAIEDYETTIEGVSVSSEPVEARSVWKTATLRNTWFASVVSSFEAAKTIKELSAAAHGHKAKFDEMVENGNEHDLLAVDELRKRYSQMQERLKEEAEINQEPNYLDAELDRKLAADYKQRPDGVIPALNDEAPSFDEAQGFEDALTGKGKIGAAPPALIEPRKAAKGGYNWAYWIGQCEQALEKLQPNDVSAWMKVHSSFMDALQVADEGLYKQLNEMIMKRMEA